MPVIFSFAEAFDDPFLKKPVDECCYIRMDQVHGVKVDVVEFLWFHGIGGVENDGFGGESGVVWNDMGGLSAIFTHRYPLSECFTSYACWRDYIGGGKKET